jgi:hypothetical protein
MMGDTMKGRSDTLKSSKFSGGARTGSTAASDNFNTTGGSKYKPSLMHPIIVESTEIMETSIDPKEWRMECERVRE